MGGLLLYEAIHFCLSITGTSHTDASSYIGLAWKIFEREQEYHGTHASETGRGRNDLRRSRGTLSVHILIVQ